MQSKNPALTALQVFTGADKGAQERRGIRLPCQEGDPLLGSENVKAEPLAELRSDVIY